MSRVLDLRKPIASTLPVRATVQRRKRGFDLKVRFPKFNKPVLVGLALLIVFTIVLPLLLAGLTQARYELADGTEELLGAKSSSLAARIIYDEGEKRYQFNKDGAEKSKAGDTNASVGQGDGSKLYSADFYQDSSKGVTVYDNINKLSIGFMPLFKTMEGKQQDNRIIYPLASSSPQLIYTLKANGLKEDIIIAKPIGDNADYSYKLNLNKDLEARLTATGALGIYSADPTLFGNISFGSDTDREKVEAARKNGKKENLVFSIPAPVINETVIARNEATRQSKPSAKFELANNILTIKASGLKDASYPLSIDPTIIVTSSSDFRKGNNESNVDFDDTNNTIKRGGLTGGAAGAWNTDTGGNFTTARMGHATVIANNYIYVIGGCNAYSALSGCTSILSDTRYAPISTTDGSVGAWQATTSLPAGRMWAAVASYNGYVYVGGGSINGDFENSSNTVYYAKVNVDGTFGSWTLTSVWIEGLSTAGLIAYGQHLYRVGGRSSGSRNHTEYAPIKADGSVGSWTTGSYMSVGRGVFATTQYNGFIYASGGNINGGNITDTTERAQVNSDGSLGSWTLSTSMPSVRTAHMMYAYGGYLYIVGGCTGTTTGLDCNGITNSTHYATIYANGAIGTWESTSSFTTSRMYAGSAYANGYLYLTGGTTNSSASSYVNDTQYAKIDGTGSTSNYSSATAFNTARWGHASVSYNGYLYVIGGCTATSSSFTNCTTASDTIRYTSINSDGTVGGWSDADTMLSPMWLHKAVAHNGYLYILGGCTVTPVTGACINAGNTPFIKINNDGTLGTWATDTSGYTARSGHGATAYGKYLYVLGGFTNLTSVQYSEIQSDGSPGAWNSATALSTCRAIFSAQAYGGHLYALGNEQNGCANARSYARVAINTDGSLGASWTVVNDFFSTGLGRVTDAPIHKGYVYWHPEGVSAQMAKINNDGSLATPVSVTHIGEQRAGIGAVVVKDFLFVVGGCTNFGGAGTTCSAMTNEVRKAGIGNGGPGTVGSWSTSSTFTTGRNNAGVAAYNGHLYVAGGCSNADCSTALSDITKAQINSDGSLGTWNTLTSTPLNETRNQFDLVAYRGYLYAMGSRTTIEYIKTNTDGTLASPTTCVPPAGKAWCTTNVYSMSGGRYGGTAVTHNGYMYMMAGQDGAGKHNDTQYAPINTDGSLGIWSTTASFTGIRDVTQGFAANGYLYIMGGYADAGTSYNDVQYAKLNSNGAIASDSGCGTSWCFTNYMQGAVRAWGGAFYYGGNVCYVGGDNNVSGADNVVQCAPVNSNGTLGIFQQTTAFATNVHNNKCTAYDGFAYCQGQFGLPNYAWYAPISSIPRKATYSRLFDLDTNVLPTKLLANGSLSSTNSKIQVNHKMVATGSTTFGSATLTDSYILDSLITLAASERQYIQVSITLDDSGSAVFPDSSVTQTTITDLLLYYRPAPAKRLRGGKTFTGEQNRGLDAQP